MQIDIVAVERSVLASFLFDNTQFEEHEFLLKIEDFFLTAHQEIFRVMQYLHNNNLPIEETFILRYIDKTQVGEQDLINLMATTAISSLTSYIDLIKEESTKRKLNKLSNEIKNDLSSELILVDEIKSKIITYIDNLDNNFLDKYEHNNSELLAKIKQQMSDAQNKLEKITHNTGLKNLDKILDGIDDGDLIVIAARPSMGKTSLIASIALESLQKGQGVLVESLEMPADKIMRRLLAVHSQENLSDIKNGLVKNLQKFNESMNFLETKNLIIHDETYPTLYKLQSRIRKILRKNPKIKNVFVDHTGKVQLEGKTREDIEIGHITNTLKKIAREYGIRVFLLQQLNRGVESRENKRPTLSDIKNSGNVEEDADIVLGLYRHSYYKAKESNGFENDSEDAEIIVLKNRDGALGTAKVIYERKTTSFKNKNLIDKASIIQFS